MPTTGELPVDAWDDEYRRTGRVLFPVRRRPAVMRCVIAGGFLALRIPRMVVGQEQGIGWWVVDWVLLSLLLVYLGYAAWQLVTGSPVVVVDATGIRRGRKSLTWPTITTVEITATASRLKLTSSTGEKLFISSENIRNLSMARAWLTHLLSTHRASGASSW